MPFEHTGGDSTEQVNTDNWQHLGDVAEKLKRKIERAISASNSEVAESYHNRLLGVEYLMRQEADK